MGQRKSKEQRLYKNLLKSAEQYILGKNYLPSTIEELMETLKFEPEHLDILKDALNTLIRSELVNLENNRYYPFESKRLIFSGELSLHRKGFGFVKPEDSLLCEKDIFIPRHQTNNAVDGDTVEVEINPHSTSEKGPEGKIITILKRGRTHVAGIIKSAHPGGDIIAYAPLLGMDQAIIIKPDRETSLKVGDRIIMKVLDWGGKGTDTTAQATHHLGHISDPTCDIPAAIEEYELRAQFPSAAIEEAKEYGTKVSLSDAKRREDLRDLECFTIDPDTAKDFDDALNVSKDKDGNYQLGVHIADVSHYVRPGTAIDDEAVLRANSTYFPGQCVPMLPPELSENLCSLRANVNRLTASVLMTFTPDGSLAHYRITRGIIKSRKRFTYKEAKQILDGEKKSSHAPAMALMQELCLLLKKKRAERGSLEFAMPDLVVMVDDAGVPTGTEYVPYDITHQLVEEFMLKANEVVATHLCNIGKDLSYRIHEEPAPEGMAEFSSMAHAFGFEISENPTPSELQVLFDEALKTSYGHFLATNYIRRMKLAIYSPKNIGHFGLGLTHYCHFTSPIRRYIDLIVHRILFGEPVDMAQLEQISNYCSQQERISERAENSVVLLKKLRLLDTMRRKDQYTQFDAVVTRVKPMGIAFELKDFMLEGFLHLSELADDYYEYNASSDRLEGVHSGTSFFSGDQIAVMVKKIDFILGEVSWNFVGTTSQKSSSRRPTKKKFKSKKGGRGRAPSSKSSKGRRRRK